MTIFFRKSAFFLLLLGFISCLNVKNLDIIKLDNGFISQKTKQVLDKSSIQLADGLKMDLWASDSLSPDPVSLEIDNLGRAYITRAVRQKNSEFDIRGHRNKKDRMCNS